MLAGDSTSPGPRALAGISRDLGPATRETGVVSHRVSCPDLVGRAKELDLIGATFDEVAKGRAATVLVGGEAGIGKTRLVEELCGRARGRGASAVTGVCVPTEGGGLPYGAVVGMVQDLARQLDEPAAAEVLGTLAQGPESTIPGLGSPARVYSAVPHIADELAKTRLFESILACVTSLAERSPVVAVFEDLQWADSASADLLGFLTRNLADARVLVIGTYRSEELGRDHPLHAWLGELARHPRVTHLHLDGLDRDETAAMIAGILGHQPDWVLTEAVWGRSDGNPFFAEELTAARDSPALPPELRGVILTRVASLSSTAQQVLRTVATAGPPVEHELLVAVCALDAASLEGALAEAVNRQVLVIDTNQTGYRFRHALLREAVYATLLPGERRRLHRQLAVAITADTSLGPSGPGHCAAELAAHWWGAGEWVEALAASASAAEAAIAVWAFPEALAHFERALSALDRSPAAAAPKGIGRLRLLEAAADVAYLAGEGQRSVDLAREAIAAANVVTDADVVTDRSSVARYYALLGRNAWAIGDSDAAFDAYRRAAALVPADPPSAELARVLAEEARGLMLMSRFADAERRCHEALAVAKAVGARAEEGHLCYTLGVSRGSLGHFDEGIALVREALAIAEELSNPDDLNRAYMGLSHLLVQSGRLEEGAAIALDSAAVGEETWGVRLNGAATNSVEALIRLGRHDEAEALLAQTGDQGVGTCTTTPSLLRAAIAIGRGRFDQAGRLLALADGLSARLADVQVRGLFHIQAAKLALEQGRPYDAYEEVERALTLAAGTDDLVYKPEMCALGVRALADAAEDVGGRGQRFDADKARLLAAGLVQEADRLVAAPEASGGRCMPRASAFASTCAAEHSRLDESDPDLWRAASGRWDAVREPYPAAYCSWREAEALLRRRGGRSRITECVQHAWRISVELGALPLRESIERLARRGRIALDDVQSTEASGFSLARDLGLTPREVEVLGQLAAGRTDREIAEALFISKKTASVHVSNLLRKLDVANRVEAGKVGQAHGLG